MKKIIIIALPLAVLATLCATLLIPDAPSLGKPQRVTPPSQPAPTVTRDASVATLVTPNASVTTRPAPLAAASLQAALNDTSMKGTVPPAPPTLDADGKLVVDTHLRAIFDYFLALDGERDEATLEHWMYSYLAQHLSSDDLSHAMDVFARYQHLQSQPVAEGLSDTDFAQILQAMMQTRREVLGSEIADAFFGEDEAYDRYTLAKMAARRDAPGDDTPIAARNDEAINALPEAMQERQQLQQKQQTLLHDTQAMEKQGASAAEIYQYLMLQGNTDAAERYQALAAQRQRWHERVTEYKHQRDLLTNDIADPQQRSLQLQQWMASQFSEQEILRIHSIERMEAER